MFKASKAQCRKLKRTKSNGIVFCQDTQLDRGVPEVALALPDPGVLVAVVGELVKFAFVDLITELVFSTEGLFSVPETIGGFTGWLALLTILG